MLARELVREPGVAQRLVTKRGSELARRAAVEQVRVLEVPWGLGLDPRAAWRLGGLITGYRPDIIHAHDSHALALALLARRSLAWLRPDLPPPAVLAHRRVDFHVKRRGSWFRADRIIAVSEAVKAVLVADGMSPLDITVVRDGIDPHEVRRAAAAPLDVRRRLGLAEGTPLAVNVAALVDHKDHRTLIHAAQGARASAPDLHWAIAGEGERRPSLEREIAELGLGDRVHLLGYIPEADALIREGNVFVMSSKEEGLGSVVLHALALGTPVVATRAGGLPEIVPAEWLVPIGDSAALGATVVRALRPPLPSPVPFPPFLTARAMAQSVLACYRSLA